MLAQEMLALSSYMTGGAMTDVAALLREAFYRYNSVDPLHPKACVWLATRTMLTLADYCQQHGLYADAHAALMKAQGQVSFYAALLTYTLAGGGGGEGKQLGSPPPPSPSNPLLGAGTPFVNPGPLIPHAYRHRFIFSSNQAVHSGPASAAGCLVC